MDLRQLISRLVGLAIILGGVGALGEATLKLGKGAALSHQKGMISIQKFNQRLLKGTPGKH